MTKEMKIGVAIGLCVAAVLIAAIAATTAKSRCEVDRFLDYDLMIAGNGYRGTDQSSATNILFLDTDAGNVPSDETDAANPNTMVLAGTVAYLCVTNDFFGPGTNWCKWTVTTAW